jgi:EAL domain-containing protein (putative c-di-GMP-specific phosphodiesterase class I)
MLVFYQPIVDLASRTTVRAEALCRFPDTAGAGKAPDNFIQHAEQQGLVKGLTDWVLATTLGFWRRLGPAAPPELAINLSPLNLQEVDLAERVFGALAKSGIESSRLWIEIDERLLSAHDAVSRSNVHKLVDAGIHISVDGFGPSLSPVSHLQLSGLRLEELKIERTLFVGLENDAEKRAKLKTIADVAAESGLELAAKGIEDEAVLEWLHRLGFARMQGYLIAPPMSEADFTAWLARERASTAA